MSREYIWYKLPQTEQVHTLSADEKLFDSIFKA